jgi:hypothetical protein
MTETQKYRQLCAVEKSIPLFSQGWWLDAVCGEENWDVILVEEDGAIAGAMPYFSHMWYGLKFISHPSLTQTLGPWIRPSKAKYAKSLGYQKDVMEGLIEKLPSFAYFSQNWHYSNSNWLPFYWKGFKQTTRYTYILPSLANEDQLWAQMEEKIRTEIRKATNRFELRVRDDLGVADFLKLNRMTFDRQGMALPYSESLVVRLDAACAERGQRKILVAEDKLGQHHAGVYIVWDDNAAYYLMGGGHPELRSSGATSLCVWEAIRHAAKVTKSFDFEGSMIESIERFFRGFGAIQTSYFNISKTPSRLLRARHALSLVVRG